ncbi:MAG: M6 family metalloprotease domain-containing protein [Bacteroidales bacterium]|nr:M6 family metalloprotease domain-containing protein [Bacteroidales bacterium]
MKTMLVTAVLFVMANTALAVPANPTPITIKQPNGKTLTLILQGDEHVNWAKTLDQYALVRNDEGFWSYGVLNEKGDMVASAFLAANKEERSAEENKFLSTLPFNLHYSSEQIKAFKEQKAYAPNPNDDKYPTQGTVKLLVILVAFQDLPFTFTNANFVSLVADSNYNGTGSVKDYYLDNSGGKFTMDIDVVGPYTIPYYMSHFGGTSNMYDFYSAAVAAANPYVNFADYDNDNDGKVDAIHFIFAGTPQSSTQNPNEIWPHRSGMYGLSGSYDGKSLNGQPYSCSAEKRNATTMDGIGTICHEFGHVLGYPDFYDTDYTGSGGEAIHPGIWDIMASGCYNNNGAKPAGLNAWEKQFTGWITIPTLTTAQDNIPLPALTDDTLAYKILLANNEFFIIEHRQQEGWDTYLPGEGLLIWHGDEDNISINGNNVNTNPNDRNWFIEPASGNYSQTESAAAPFPGTSGNTLYTDNSTPASTTKNGNTTGKPITGIRYINDSVISFNFMSNRPAVQTKTIKVGTVTGTSAMVTGKVVYYGAGGASGITQQGFYWNTDPENVDENANVVYGSLSNDSIIATLTSLSPSTMIYYRAFATNAYGTAVGNLMQFTTLSGLGTVSTAVATNIGDNTVTLGGNLNNEGDAIATDMGVVYTTYSNVVPTIESDSVVVVHASSVGLGAFAVNVTGLQEGVRYYYRAFVTSALGTGYGSKLNFRTTYPPVYNNTISDNQTLCSESVPTLVTGTMPTGGLDNFTYLWQQKGRTGSNWITADGINNTQNYQPPALMDSTFYRRIVISNGTIQDTSNIILMNVLVSRGGNLTKKVSDTVGVWASTDTLKVTGQRGSVIDWERQYNEQSWLSLSNTANTHIEMLDAEGSYEYRVKVQLESCPVAYSNVVTIYAASNALIDVCGQCLKFNVYPNPSNGIFTLTSDVEGKANLTITNSTGALVYELKDCQAQYQALDLSNLANGAYILTLISGDKINKKQIIIKK